MDNQLQSVSKIFNEKLYRIPDYQRGYAWGNKQLKDFWSDIIYLEEGKNHYVGVLTLERVPKETYSKWEEDMWIIESKSFEPYYVVDGQQRLTTTIVLIQAITEVIDEGEELNYFSIKEIKKRFIFDSKDGGVSRSYIFGYEKDNPSYEFLKTMIFNEASTSGYNNETTIYTNNLENAKVFFIEKLKELSKSEIQLIFKKVTQNLLFNIYSISSDIDVFISFETMNNRGKPLSILELLKNRLIYLSTKFQEEEIERNHLRKIINDGWKGVYHFLGKNKENALKDDVFLSSHYMIYFGMGVLDNLQSRYEENPNRFIFESSFERFLLEEKFTLRKIIDEKKSLKIKDISNYVESLQDSVKIWFDINNPNLSIRYSDEEKNLIERLIRIGINNFSSLLLAVYLKKFKKEQVIKFLEKIEIYAFIYMLLNYRYYSRIHDFTLEAISIHNGKLNLTDLIKQLDEKIKEVTEREDFVDKLIDRFKSDGFYEWKGIRYFLFEYEIELKNKSKTKNQKINWHEYNNNLEDFISVEHIYPQKADYDCWKKTFNIYKPRERKILNNSLGNLLPLSRPKNSSLQNKCFIDKVDNGKNSIGYRYGSYCENEITKFKEWTPNHILQRGLKLLYFMEKRWGLDFKTHDKRVELLNLKFVKEELNV